jgi:hypothetical protein
MRKKENNVNPKQALFELEERLFVITLILLLLLMLCW